MAERDLTIMTHSILAKLQAIVDAKMNYPARVVEAKRQWDNKLSTSTKALAFHDIRKSLAQMCVGPVRCVYCEDSLADEVEHIQPKNLFPELTFVWKNYLFACGPCNGPKRNRHGVIVNSAVAEFIRRHQDPILPPPAGQTALINPRTENPLEFLNLDIGGVTPSGVSIDGTFDFLPADNLSCAKTARAIFTIEVLGLNREVMRVARENAFGGFRARLREYVREKERAQGSTVHLQRLKRGMLRTPHLTVFEEMRRQRARWPDINNLLKRAPEIAGWLVVKRS